MNDCFVLFPFIKLIKGYKSSSIIDLQNETIRSVLNNNYLAQFISGCNGKLVSELDSEILVEVLNMNLGVILPSSLIYNFPKLSSQWDYPGKFSNAIINFKSREEVISVFNTLNEIQVKTAQIIIQSKLKDVDFVTLLDKVTNSTLENVQVILNDESYINDSILEKILVNLKITSLIIYSSEENKSYNLEGKIIAFITHKYAEKLGPESRGDMIVNIPFFMESQKHNTYYNRKIFFDGKQIFFPYTERNPKKYYSANEYLKEFAQKDSIWRVNKETIDVCKDCEYRYSCFDRRIPTRRNVGQFFNDVECNYNPYTCEWEEN